MSEAVSKLELRDWDAIGAQGKAISARLQLGFPPALFQFKFLPANAGADKAVWKNLTQGNQPFLGLGFGGIVPKTDGRIFMGVASWMLLVSVRMNNGTPKSLFYGDKQGIGALKMAAAAASLLHGMNAATGTLTVAKIANSVSDAWAEDHAVIALDLLVPLTLRVDEAILKPDGLGLFEELLTVWNVPGPQGGVDTYSSDWENPNVSS
jgi:hypothetical protein